MKLPDSDQLTNVLASYLRGIPIDFLAIDERVDLVCRALTLFLNVGCPAEPLRERYPSLVDRPIHRVVDTTPDPRYDGVAANAEVHEIYGLTANGWLLVTTDGQLLAEMLELGAEESVYRDGQRHFVRPIAGYVVRDLPESDLRDLLDKLPYLARSIVAQVFTLLQNRGARLKQEQRCIDSCCGQIDFLLKRFTYPQQRVE